MLKFLVAITAVLGLSACSTPSPKGATRVPSSDYVDYGREVMKQVGDKIEVTRGGRVNQNPDVSVVPIDARCPEEMPIVATGGCQIKGGPNHRAVSVSTGSTPMVSDEQTEGFRCLFEDLRRDDEVSVTAYCRRTRPGQPRRHTSLYD